MVEKLSAEARAAGIKSLKGWAYDDKTQAIEQAFKFKSFNAAFGFMARVALEAEKAGHHPDWSNSYDTVTIRLSTHDAGGLSQKDIDLAAAIDAILG